MSRVRSLLYWVCHPVRWTRYVRVQTALYGALAIFGKRGPSNMIVYRALSLKVRVGSLHKLRTHPNLMQPKVDAILRTYPRSGGALNK